MKKIIVSAVVLAAALVMLPSSTFSAPPDGDGVWADQILAAPQGPRQDGGPVSAENSDPWDALGLAESVFTPSDTHVLDSSFFSLGFGGKITLAFDQPIQNVDGPDLEVFAIDQNPNDPTVPHARAMVEASNDPYTWTVIATDVAGDAKVDLGPLTSATYVQITDTSDPQFFPAEAEGYRVDGVRAITTPPISGLLRWRGRTKGMGYWRHDGNPGTDILNGHVYAGAGRGNFCQKFWNEAITFNNNYELNSSYNGVPFRQTVFHANRRMAFRQFAGMSIEDIHDAVMVAQCDDSSDPQEILTLRKVLAWVNGRQLVWSSPTSATE